MLKPKQKIGIVYGHDVELLDFTLRKIEELAESGHRVRAMVINRTTLLRIDDNIWEAVKRMLSEIEGAFIFMTPDDYAISVKDMNTIIEENRGLRANELKERLKYRARQNVIFELGYAAATVGENRYRIFCPGELDMEIPSDINNKFRVTDLSFENVGTVIEDFVLHNLKNPRRPSSLRDTDYRMNYSNLCDDPDRAIDEFEKEYAELDSVDDQLIYVFERIVFDVYFQKKGWWMTRIASIEAQDTLQRASLDILFGVSDYHSSWILAPDRSNSIQDTSIINIAISRLERGLRIIDSYDVNPIVKIVGLDYLGLAYQKLGRDVAYGRDRRITFYEQSEMAFEESELLAKEYDDRCLQLWVGYVLYNRARTINERQELQEEVQSHEWRRLFDLAISTRKSWRNCPYTLPLIVREGLESEYHHAVAERVWRGDLDELGTPIEDPPYNLTREKILLYHEEYRNWWTDPLHIRVRLAATVHKTWNQISSRHPHLELPSSDSR